MLRLAGYQNHPFAFRLLRKQLELPSSKRNAHSRHHYISSITIRACTYVCFYVCACICVRSCKYNKRLHNLKPQQIVKLVRAFIAKFHATPTAKLQTRAYTHRVESAQHRSDLSMCVVIAIKQSKIFKRTKAESSGYEVLGIRNFQYKYLSYKQ